MFSRKPKQVNLIVATRQRVALIALDQLDANSFKRREALTTAGLYQILPGAQLIIVDLDDLAESPEWSRARLSSVLANTLMISGAEFAADPQHYLDRAQALAGLTGALPARCVAFTGLSGGVGKSTLALSFAHFFRHKTGLPSAVIELSVGPSALLALLAKDDQDWSHLYEVISQGQAWPTWDGVTLAGMAWDTARLLNAELIDAAWQAIIEQHVLTVIDAPAYHPHWPLAAALADRTFIVSDNRPDALANAVWLLQQDSVPDHSALLLNRGGLAAKLALPQPPLADLPDVGRAAQSFPAQLGRKLMALVYPGWK
jgi:hypothetical protein